MLNETKLLYHLINKFVIKVSKS
uniref:Uncharacterized protein n=1 Tax=Rhizophora mucronata TaxID=61149 RepID=A0A2P2NDD1_RHIMU